MELTQAQTQLYLHGQSETFWKLMDRYCDGCYDSIADEFNNILEIVETANSNSEEMFGIDEEGEPIEVTWYPASPRPVGSNPRPHTFDTE